MNTNKAARRPAKCNAASRQRLTYSIYILDSKEEKFSKIQRYASNKFNNLPIDLHAHSDADLSIACVFALNGNLNLTTLFCSNNTISNDLVDISDL